VTKISGYIQPKRRYIACNWHSTMSYCVPVLWRRQDLVQGAAAVLGKKYLGAWPSSFGRQHRLSEITIEPIKNLRGLGKIWGPVPPSLAYNRYWRGWAQN